MNLPWLDDTLSFLKLVPGREQILEVGSLY